MLEATDAQIGRIADALGDRGVLVVTADNGTSAELVRAPASPRRAKQTVYAGGVRVPFVVTGPDVVAGVRDDLVHVTDLFATVLDLAGVADPPSTDGASLSDWWRGGEGPRQCLFVEQFAPNGLPAPRNRDTAVVEDEWVLVAHPGVPDELYHRDPARLDDGEDLRREALDPEARAALRRLRARLRRDE